jgi:hypothetical protein
MATIGGPNTEKDNLVFGYDTGYGANSTVTNSRYYQGKPTSNLSNDMTKYFNNWSGMTGSTSYYTTEKGNQGVHLITTNGGGVQFYSSSTINNISASTEYTVSATIKYSGTTPHVNMFYVRQYHNGSQITEGGKFSTSYMIDLGGGWYRAYRTFTTTSTTSYIVLQGYQYSSGVNLKIQDLQFEIGNQLSPYIGSLGTRSSTQSLIDLTKTTDIDVSNVSFSSTGQPDFDGTDDYIQIPDPNISSSNGFSIEMIIKPTNASSQPMVITPNSGGIDHFVRFNSNGRLYMRMVVAPDSSVQDFTTTTSLSSTGYHYVVFTFKQSEGGKAYYNGNQESAASANFTAIDWSNVWKIGQRGNNTFFFDGELPILKVHNKVLSANEVKQNFNAYKNRFDI